jgi:hypothetical protein
MHSEPKSLNIPYPRKDYWKVRALFAVILFTPVLLIFSTDVAKAYCAGLLAFLPGLWLLIMSERISKPLKEHSDIGRVFYWVLITGYMWFAKAVLFPAAIGLIDHVFA